MGLGFKMCVIDIILSIRTRLRVADPSRLMLKERFRVIVYRFGDFMKGEEVDYLRVRLGVEFGVNISPQLR